MKENLLQLIFHHIFGYKYYTVLYNVRGTFECGIGGRIFDTYEEAKQSLEDNGTYKCIGVVSFRSHTRFVNGTSPQGYACCYIEGTEKKRN